MYDQLTPEEKLISDNFQGNKGKLPWPTERGVVTSRFGKHQHAVLKQVTVQNDGIDISTVQGAEARALFDGVVSKVVAILGANYTVIIRHGNFLTVYQNLINVRVKPGEEVSVKQILGTIFTEEDTNSTLLHIEIWKELNKQNPEDWLSSKL
jgi:murein DD-endopeptidase MepM/ murein hydrolase activator NlpD